MRNTAKVVPIRESSGLCARCAGAGSVLTVALDRMYPALIPASVLLTKAMPCDCGAGVEFAHLQRQFRPPAA